MQHIKVVFAVTGNEVSDMLIALLSDAGYQGFEETESELLAYVSEADFNSDELNIIASGIKVTYTTEVIPAQNWNALWESNFEPVVVDGFCTIRAHFHDIVVSTPYDIVITPKMSFGTGHHATTQLMMMQMKDMEFAKKSVLDFGTGTGVLAILAEMLGAAKIIAIDNDEWSVENAAENIDRNESHNITIRQGSPEDIGEEKFDIILANINRHILLKYMSSLNAGLNEGGKLLMSGLLTDDKSIILEAASHAGFKFIAMTEQANWISMLFDK